MRATVDLTWPHPPLPGLELPVARLMSELEGLWPLLARTIGETGPGCLWALRWDPDERWQVLSVPPHGVTEFPVADTPGARERDAWTVTSALVGVAAGRVPRDLPDALDLLDLHAGVIPHGLDAIVHALFGGGNAARVHTTVTGRGRADILSRAAAETAVGSGKAGYEPEFDNEDSFEVFRDAEGVLQLIVCDGVTGPADGSGALASREAVREIRRVLETGATALEALDQADVLVVERTPGASTALLAAVDPDGRARLHSVGDSPAWLVRPGPDRRRIAWRLTPDQTVLAETRLVDPAAVLGASALTQNLGGDCEAPFVTDVPLQPGDLLLLLSDGAAIPDTIWFGHELAAMADAYPHAPALAAALIARAERLGGRDNATAVIAEIHPAS